MGDVPHTYANIQKANKDLGYKPKIKLEEGLIKLYESYDYYFMNKYLKKHRSNYIYMSFPE